MKSRHGKVSRKKTASLMMVMLWVWGLLASSPAFAAPQGGVVTSGTAAIAQSGNVTNINQSTNAAAINWQSFSVKPVETVNFNQPSASSLTLNRVIGNERSIIEGAINATGKVFLLNSNGILFTKDSSVNTAGFIASTLNLTNEDFNAGNYVFRANGSTGSVINMGAITARDGGYVALLGNSVSNQGIITATKGTIAMASGDKVTLNFNGDSLLSVTVDEGALNALVENKEAIYADGGKVIMTAKAANDLLTAQVNTSGIIQARTIDDLKGSIELHAYNGTSTIDGILDASAPTSGDGGFIETSGTKVKVNDTAVITTKSATGKNGMWLIDPTDFNIVSGGDALTDSGIGVDTLKASLDNGDVSIFTPAGGTENGDININAALDWSAASGTPLNNSLWLSAAGDINVNAPVSWTQNTITLAAAKNVYVNAVMKASGTANLAANYGAGKDADGVPYGLYTPKAFYGRVDFSGSGSVILNGTPYRILTLDGLNALKDNPTGNWVAGADISRPWNDKTLWSSGIGTDTVPFTGTLNALGHTVIGGTQDGTGLFNVIGEGGTVSNLSGSSAMNSVAGYRDAAGGIANVNRGNIINCYVSGTLYNTNIGSAGGLVGTNYGLIAQSYQNSGPIYASHVAGGLVGTNYGTIIDSAVWVNNSYLQNTAGAATITYVGGLVGVNEAGGIIRRSYTNNYVKLTDTASMAGSFVGKNSGTIEESYATAANGWGVNQGPHLAGFVYENTSTGRITDSYTSLNYYDKSAKWDAGFAYINSGVINHAYALEYSGNTLNSARYGFVQSNTGTISDAYWYADIKSGARAVTDSAIPSGATQLSAADAKDFTKYTGFNTDIWGASASGYPILRNIMVYALSQSTLTYGDATSEIGTLGLTTVGLQGGDDSNLIVSVPAPYGYLDAGTYSVTTLLAGSPYKNIKGNSVTIKPADIGWLIDTVTAKSKVYDGTTTAQVAQGLTSNVIESYIGIWDEDWENLTPQTLGVTYTGTFSDKNVGTKNVTFVYTLTDGENGGKASNYTISNTTTTASITPKPITADITVSGKTYDGTTQAPVSYQLPGKISGDNLSLGYSALFDNANAGTGKTVTLSILGLTGTDSGNYLLQNTASQQMNRDIAQRILGLWGEKQPDGSAACPASGIRATNLVPGDQMTLTGSVALTSADAGLQRMTDLGGLHVNNPNYTLTGATGAVAIGQVNLALDKVVSGDISIATLGTTTTITQGTDKAVIDWLRFTIAANETVNFVQPHSYSIVLNRVAGPESIISGTLTANGRVFIINSNGILFAAGSSVNVGGLVASAMQITNDNFLNNNYIFVAAPGSGPVINEGDIVIVDGGFVALASNNGVTNSNKLTAHGGKALLVSADTLTLTLNEADSTLTGYAIEGLNGTTTVGGAVNVADGGLLETAGSAITLAGGFTPNTGTGGTWSLSLPTITIGSGITSGAFVNNNLGSRNLSLNALDGDLSVSSAVNWSADTILSLAAGNDININRSIIAGGANAGLVMNYGNDYHIDTTHGASVTLSGANASLSMNNNPYTLIRSMEQLDGLDHYNAVTGIGAATNVSGYYALAQDLDASASEAIYTFSPVYNFSGTFAGLGHTISNLTIVTAGGVSDYLGFIGKAKSGSVIRDIGLPNINIDASSSMPYAKYVGALVGYNYGIVKNVYAGGRISGSSDYYGGLVGYNDGGTITDSHADVYVMGLNYVGGLVGYSNGGTIANSYATGRVPESYNFNGNYKGGLIGYALYTTITDSYATGYVDGVYYVGGLVGQLGAGSSITDSWASGPVGGQSAIGGLVGYSAEGNTIADSHATGNVNGLSATGGLVGINSGAIEDSWATGKVDSGMDRFFSGNTAGGLVGTNTSTGTIDRSYATGNVTGNGLNSAFGGLVGDNYGRISDSTAWGNVTNNGSRFVDVYSPYDGSAGGLVGRNHEGGIIERSRAYGNVTIGNSWVLPDGSVPPGGAGGLVGWNDGRVDNSHAEGSVIGPDLPNIVHGVAGIDTGTITDSTYHDAPAERAAFAAWVATVSADVGNTTGYITDQTLQYQSGSSGSGATGGQEQYQSVGSGIVFADSDSYGAHIKAISTEGATFELEDDSRGENK